MKSLFMVISLFSLAPGCLAFAETKWTIQAGDIKIKRPNGTEVKLIEDEIYKQPPQLQKGACGENGAPLCVGYVLVKDGNTPPRVGPVACKAIKKDNKWKCPTAAVCYDDEDVSISKLATLPSASPTAPTAPRPTPAPSGGSPQGVRESQGDNP